MGMSSRVWPGVVSGLVLGLLASTALAAETVRYVALVDGGKKAGHQIVTHGDDGVTQVDFIFKDNGRGPELSEQYTLAGDGTFATYKVSGASTFGAPVAESFSREGNTARWKSTSDEGLVEWTAPRCTRHWAAPRRRLRWRWRRWPRAPMGACR